MPERSVFDELRERVSDAIRQSPAADVERNVRALLLSFFDRMDLVTREDFEIQKRLLQEAQKQISSLEQRLADIEARKNAPAG